MTTVTLDETGSVHLPEEVRKDLGLRTGDRLDVEVTSGPAGPAVVLRQHVPEEDAWAYTKEHLDAVREAEEDFAAGRVFTLSPAEIRKLADVADDIE